LAGCACQLVGCARSCVHPPAAQTQNRNQNSLHPKTKPPQGGFLSIAEAAYHSVPIVGLSLIVGQGELIRSAVDQVRTDSWPLTVVCCLLVFSLKQQRGRPTALLARLPPLSNFYLPPPLPNEKQGRGLMLHKSVLSRGQHQQFADAVRSVLTTPSFAKAAALASARLKAVRIPYREQAADWVEFAATLRDHGPFFTTQGQVMPWWQVACLDVAAVLAAIVLLPALAAYMLWTAARERRAAEQEEGVVDVQLMFAPSSGKPRVAAADNASPAPPAQLPAPQENVTLMSALPSPQAPGRRGKGSPISAVKKVL
jgi:hypothetical protein